MSAKMKNEYIDYMINRHTEWHTNEVGKYHISAIGNSHADLDPKDHYGPCIRSTYIDYVNKLPHSLTSLGNFKLGNILHKHIQKVYKKNHPLCSIEFGLQSLLKLGRMRILSLGSIDIIDQKFIVKKTYDGLIHVDIVDVKTASQYTLPKNKYDRNPTYFSQGYQYASSLFKNYFDPEVIVVDEIKILYASKHNLEIYPIKALYEPEIAMEKWKDYVKRCWMTHRCLKKKILPDPEEMRWCKYCKYRFRCGEDSLVAVKRGIEYRQTNKLNFSAEDYKLMKENGDV